MPFDAQALLGDEWERRKIRNRIQLTFAGCLGPCAVCNNALLLLYGQSIWLKDLNTPDLACAVFDWIAEMLAARRLLARSPVLSTHVYARFKEPAGDVNGIADSTDDGLDRLDPVCLMDVDPDTAKNTVEYAARTLASVHRPARSSFSRTPRPTSECERHLRGAPPGTSSASSSLFSARA
jgi:hypothetical protein